MKSVISIRKISKTLNWKKEKLDITRNREKISNVIFRQYVTLA